jgi:hypothetical protein
MPLSKITNPFLDPAGAARSNVYSPSANTIGIVTSGLDRVRVDSSGSVGVGTTTLTNKFNVAGAIQSTSTLVAIDPSSVAMSQEAGFSRIAAFGPDISTPGTLDLMVISAVNGGIQRGVRIDSLGRLTNAYTPFFYAERSGSAQTGYNAASQGDVVVIYNSAITNTGSHYSTSTGKFTAPVTGVYAFFAGAYSSTMNFNQMWLVVNGSRGNGTDWNYGSGSVNFQVGHWIIKLSANDTVGFHPYNGTVSSGSIDVNGSHVYFRGVLLS